MPITLSQNKSNTNCKIVENQVIIRYNTKSKKLKTILNSTFERKPVLF